jgi:hypothetical protein
MAGMDKRPQSRSNGTAAIAIGLLLLPILYMLSVGPAIWLCNRGAITRRQLFTAYAPIAWIEGRNETFDGALDFYVKLWVPDWKVYPPP